MDIVGLIPGVGEIADGVNGLIYTARGDALNVTLSFSAMIQVVGWASTGGKFAKKGKLIPSLLSIWTGIKVPGEYNTVISGGKSFINYINGLSTKN